MRYFLCAICAGLLLVGCGEKIPAPENHPREESASGHDHGQEGGGATYEEGKGISLQDETRKSIGLELIEVTQAPMPVDTLLTAQVYREASESTRKHGAEKTGMAYASAQVDQQTAQALTPGQTLVFQLGKSADKIHAGRVWKIGGVPSGVNGKKEILLELSDPDESLPIGAFVEARVPSSRQAKSVISIPRLALLKNANGIYVFVENSGSLLRTEVKTGIEHADNVEITSGLYEGDVIAVKPVETLYMIELRATKGGGHSH